MDIAMYIISLLYVIMWNLEITVWQAERESKTIYVENRKVMTKSKIGSGNLYNPVQNH